MSVRVHLVRLAPTYPPRGHFQAPIPLITGSMPCSYRDVSSCASSKTGSNLPSERAFASHHPLTTGSMPCSSFPCSVHNIYVNEPPPHLKTKKKKQKQKAKQKTVFLWILGFLTFFLVFEFSFFFSPPAKNCAPTAAGQNFLTNYMN